MPRPTDASSARFAFRADWIEAGTHRDAAWRRIYLVRALLAHVRLSGAHDPAAEVQALADWTGTYPQEAEQFYTVARTIRDCDVPSAGLTEDQRRSIDLAALVKLSQAPGGETPRLAVLRRTPWFARVSREPVAAAASPMREGVFAHVLDVPAPPGPAVDHDGFWFGVLLAFVHRGLIARREDPATGRVVFTWDVRPIDHRPAVAAAAYLGVPWPTAPTTASRCTTTLRFHGPAFDALLQRTGTPVRRSEESVATFAARQRATPETTHYAACPAAVRRAMLAGMVEAVGTVQASQARAKSTTMNVMLQITGDPVAVAATRRLAEWVTDVPLAKPIRQERGTSAKPRDRSVWRVTGATTVTRFLAALRGPGAPAWPLTERADALAEAATHYDVLRSAIPPLRATVLPCRHIHADLVLAALGGYHRGCRTDPTPRTCSVADIVRHQDVLPNTFYRTGNGPAQIGLVNDRHVSQACGDLVARGYVASIGGGPPTRYALTDHGTALLFVAHSLHKRPVEILRETEDFQFPLAPGLTMFASTHAGGQGVLIRDVVPRIPLWYHGVRFLFGDDLKPSAHGHLLAEGVILGAGTPDLVFLHHDPVTGDRRLGVVEVVSATAVTGMSNAVTDARVRDLARGLYNAQSLPIDYLTVFHSAPSQEQRAEMALFEAGRFWAPEFGNTPPYAAHAAVPQPLRAPFPRIGDLIHLTGVGAPWHIAATAHPPEADASFDPWLDAECPARDPDAPSPEGERRPLSPRSRPVR